MKLEEYFLKQAGYKYSISQNCATTQTPSDREHRCQKNIHIYKSSS